MEPKKAADAAFFFALQFNNTNTPYLRNSASTAYLIASFKLRLLN